MNPFLKEAQELQERLVQDRRWLHAHPEVGGTLPETVAYVKKRLLELHCTPEEICDSGLVVLLGGKKEGPCILLRADMDALPMKEETGLPFASENGCAHSCGHDMHTAMLLGVAALLKAHEDELRGTVKLMFQPGEEVFLGAERMLQAGVLENPKVDAAITLHVNGLAPFPSGTLSIADAGAALASCDSYRITVHGKGGHGAYPSQTIDPIAVAAHILVALQQINARELGSKDTAVLTQGSFHSGKAPNIIPDTAVIEGTLRTFDEQVRQRCLKRMEAILTGVGAALQADVDFTVLGGCSPLYNDAAVRADALRYFRELVGEAGVAEKHGEPGMASEDFGNVLARVPGIQVGLAVNSAAEGAQYPMHNPKVLLKEEPLYIGTAAMAYLAKRWLEEH
ncbi:hypothetical protein B5G43_01875 [Flavonifractor sp. An92]|uniref:M20 metallopeptidase family protein n=1 Tax=Flavonifractor sp. An92 TaxID=1965666 RepID=UPI000B38075D|nr:M20 family metallopeptidase [Flavonifractor sp. An92]OUN08155.1 hypothetical protein B5G43_01875 [Flavonifractor sp. An92]